MSAPPPSPSPRIEELPDSSSEEAQVNEDEAERKAFESWGYLFRPDRTGTENLRHLLRALQAAINTSYPADDSTSDLLPQQLAAFYRDVGGNYDTLFLHTPPASLAFIYRSLGCLYSLQPHPGEEGGQGWREPVVPALKGEGWVLWQTIQILLGPEEHSGFLRRAVERWDLGGGRGGLGRRCFPEVPDRHMVGWYEGVSERLKREAEVEREVEAGGGREESGEEGEGEGERGPALAYFRNPMFRHVESRGGMEGMGVRRESGARKRSPKPTFGERVRSVVSPGGRRGVSRERERRRRSLGGSRHRFSGDFDPVEREQRFIERSDGYDDPVSPEPLPPRHDPRHRRRSSRSSRPVSINAPPPDEDRPPTPQPSSPPLSPTLRHARSHEPSSYFPAPTSSTSPRVRRASAYERERERESEASTPPPIQTSVGPSFAPSASPLFASHVARQPQPPPPPMSHAGVERDEIVPPRRTYPSGPRRPPPENYDSAAPSISSRSRDRERELPRRSHHPRPPYDDRYDDESPPPPSRARHRSRSRRSEMERARRSGSEISSFPDVDRERERRRGSVGGKQTRFAADVGGVGGRRYPDGSPWR